MKISVTIITYNEEAKIRDALESVKWADEIVVVDSFSTDRTAEICKQYTDRIYYKEFIGFGALKNLAIDLATHDWILSLDADERVTDDLRMEQLRINTDGPKADGYVIRRKNFFLGRWVRHCGWYPDYRSVQFFNRKKGRYTDDLVHERLALWPGARKVYLKGHIEQFPFIDLNQFVSKYLRYARLRATDMGQQGRRFHFHQVVTQPVFTFLKLYFLRLGFADGLVGLIIAVSYAYFTFVKYATLRELKSRGK